ncbi:MAG: TAXI family TRAP transporter solute-binding subunit [Rhizobiaceae bacterium]|nr:TAXI family TRAP transporter solute-binding subunit [Rhizobiaceae bacterium]
MNLARRLVGASALAAAVALSAGQAAAQDKSLELVSGTVTGSWFSHMVALGETVFKPAGFGYNNSPGGGTSNVMALSTGKADAGFTMPLVLSMAAAGLEPFSEKIDNVSVLAALYPDPWELIVPADSDITSYTDLKGKTIVGAPPGQLSAVALADLLETFEMTGEVNIRQASQSEGVALVQDRHVDAFGWIAPTPISHIQELALTRPLRWLNLSEEDLAKLNEVRPGYIPHVIPAGTYPGQDEDIHTIQTPVVLAVRNDLPEETAYEMTKALVEGIEALRNSGPSALKSVQPADLAKVGDNPLHPGAAKYYREKGFIN